MNGKPTRQREQDQAQHARFLETARVLGCDEDEAAFDEKLKEIAKPVIGVIVEGGQEKNIKKRVV